MSHVAPNTGHVTNQYRRMAGYMQRDTRLQPTLNIGESPRLPARPPIGGAATSCLPISATLSNSQPIKNQIVSPTWARLANQWPRTECVTGDNPIRKCRRYPNKTEYICIYMREH